MLRKGRTRRQASAQFAGEWSEGGTGNAFSPYSGGPTRSGGLKGRGQCEALHSPETPGTLSAWPVRRRMSSKTIENERACGPLKLSQGLFRQAESASPALFSAAAVRRAPLCPFCFCRSSHFRLRAAFSSRRRRPENFRLRGSE